MRTILTAQRRSGSTLTVNVILEVDSQEFGDEHSQSRYEGCEDEHGEYLNNLG